MADFAPDTQIHWSPLKGIITLIILAFTFQVFAQASLSSKSKKAIKYYEKGQEDAKERDFEGAIDWFRKALLEDPAFYEAYLRKGSLFNAMGMEDSVYRNFESYLALTPTPIPTVLDRVASMAFDRGAYDQSKNYLDELLALIPELEKDRAKNLLLKSIEFAKKELENPQELSIKPLPPEVNRFSLQYLPAITIDNSTLVYTKRDRLDGDEDIVVSYQENGVWSEAQSISSRINTPLNEGASTISADGKIMIYTSCDRRGSFGSCDLYISRKYGEVWSRPKNLGKPINSRYWESQPSLSADGKTLYFSSNRPGGKGGRDLWVSYSQNDMWSNPVNVGETVNSFKDETTPFIHPNGETLYFSSNGHVGMGGYDLYKTDKLDSIWTQPLNLGYPINSFNDEVALLLSGDGKTAFFAQEQQRGGKILDSKIVSFQLPDSLRAKPASYIVGQVTDKSTNAPLRAQVEIVDLERNDLLFDSSSDSITGTYTMVLPSGTNIACYVKKKGYLYHEYNFFSEPSSPSKPDTINIALRPIAENESLILKNIYFELDSYELNSKSLSEIANVLEILNENPSIEVEISGHTDNLGTRSYNLQLSENRAKRVLDELVKNGITSTRLSHVGHADSYPISDNETESGRKSNRRIEFKITRIRN